MALTVYGRATSSNVQAVMWGAAELGLSPERIDIGFNFGGTDTPEFRAMSPTRAGAGAEGRGSGYLGKLRDPALSGG